MFNKLVISGFNSISRFQSSLLSAILGELEPLTGNCKVVGRMAYAPQEPWIFSGTVRQNILCGLEYDTERYNRVIEACALVDDIRLFPKGDSTSVGERGVSLSGGQKARINLARALYVEADIYLLDDPLSAVDAHVGRHLFDSGINSFLNGKIRVLVTHQLHYLKDADRILILNQVIFKLIKLLALASINILFIPDVYITTLIHNIALIIIRVQWNVLIPSINCIAPMTPSEC